MILYLHGFRSSPQSFKARLLREQLHTMGKSEKWLCPQLPASPAEAMQLMQQLVSAIPAKDLTLIGSSLGGYYATALAEQIGCRAVLLNPAVTPAQDLERQVGLSTAWHSDDPFDFKPEYVGQLAPLAVPQITQPQRYFLLAATGDEVLDWRSMTAHYAGARQHVIEGSDHGMSDFDKYMDEVLQFCGI
jgi:predicted esterase YcpF (UPF0227 family)